MRMDTSYNTNSGRPLISLIQSLILQNKAADLDFIISSLFSLTSPSNLSTVTAQALEEKYGILASDIHIWRNGRDSALKRAILEWMKELVRSYSATEWMKSNFKEIEGKLCDSAQLLPSGAHFVSEPNHNQRGQLNHSAQAEIRVNREAKTAPVEQSLLNRSTECQRLTIELLARMAVFQDLVVSYRRIVEDASDQGDPKNGKQKKFDDVASEMDVLLNHIILEVEEVEKIPMKDLAWVQAELETREGRDDNFQASPALDHLIALQFEWILLQINLQHLQFQCHLSFMIGNAKTSNVDSLRYHFINSITVLVVATAKCIGVSELSMREHLADCKRNLASSSLDNHYHSLNEKKEVISDILKLMNKVETDQSAKQSTVEKNARHAIPSERLGAAHHQTHSKSQEEAIITKQSMLDALLKTTPKILSSVHVLVSQLDSSLLHGYPYELHKLRPGLGQLQRLLNVEMLILRDFLFICSSLPHAPLYPPTPSASPSPSLFHSSPATQILPELGEGQRLSLAVSSLSSLFSSLSEHLDAFKTSTFAEKLGCRTKMAHLHEMVSIHLSKLRLASTNLTPPRTMTNFTSSIAKNCAALTYAEATFKNPLQMDATLQVLHHLLQLKFQLPKVLNMIGIIEMAKGRLAQSLASFKQSAKEDSSFLPALYNMSRLYHREKLYDPELKLLQLLLPHVEAREEDNEGLNSIPASMIITPLSSSLVRWRLAICYSNKGQFERAIQELDAIEKTLPSCVKEKVSSCNSTQTNITHAILDVSPWISQSSLRNEKAKLFLAMQDYTRILVLFSVPSALQEDDKNGSIGVEEACHSGKAEFWKKGHPDVVSMLMISEALFHTKRSSEALNWLTFVCELLEDLKFQNEKGASSSVSSPSSRIPPLGHLGREPSFIHKGNRISKCTCGSTWFAFSTTPFGVQQYLLLYFDALNNMASIHQCRQNYELAMNTFAKAKMIAEKIVEQHKRFLRLQSSHLASLHFDARLADDLKESAESQTLTDLTESALNKSVLNRLLVANYNFCLLAFKLGKKEKSAMDWISYRFKIPNFHTLSSPVALKDLKMSAESSLKLVHKDAMVHDSFVCINGEIPEWQLLQLDIHLLSLAIHLHMNAVVV